MGGDIKVFSEYGKGSIFTIELPQKIRSIEPLAAVANPKEKRVLVYENNKIYADSIICAVDNLGVNCDRVESDEDMLKKLNSNDYSFIFVSNSSLIKVKKVAEEFKSNAKIILLAEFGNTNVDKSSNVLAMPAQSISIANMLNGVSDSFSYNVNENTAIRFIAPSARILIVDDIGTNLKVAEGLISPYKMQIDLCFSGFEAIEIAEGNSYDLIFMDHMMPEMDGIEATKIIRNLGGKGLYYKNLPIIALTANAVSGVKEMFLANGFNDFLSKPIDTVKLNAILEKWIPKWKQEKVNSKIKNTKSNQNNSSSTIEIKGVNTKKGIETTGGDLEFYMQTLALFCKDSIQKIEEIKESLKTKDYNSYTIYVHALKSISANIGAIDLSEAAKKLEIAGRQRDIAFIDANNAQLITDLKAVLSDIDKVFANSPIISM
jgi:CheY-like chemotaxis protein/HPt (histidine-containing phosphotransfer) domain-containing protein